MNFTYKSFLLAVMLAFPFANNSFAQQTNENIVTSLNLVKGFSEVTSVSNNLASANTIMSDNIRANYPKLMKSFSTLFQHSSNQQWTEVNQNLFVSFINNGKKTRACFTKDGIMNYAITDYDWKQLPERLQQHIKNNYPGYTVFNAIEIDAYNTTAHQIILKDADGFITLKSTVDGIEEISHVSKL
jgi:hypothetical protein